MKRSAIRELTFRLIYSLEIQKPEDLEEQIELYMQCNGIEDNEAKEYIKDAIIGIKENVVIKELASNLQRKIKEDVKKVADLEVQEVNVKVTSLQDGKKSKE